MSPHHAKKNHISLRHKSLLFFTPREHFCCKRKFHIVWLASIFLEYLLTSPIVQMTALYVIRKAKLQFCGRQWQTARYILDLLFVLTGIPDSIVVFWFGSVLIQTFVHRSQALNLSVNLYLSCSYLSIKRLEVS